MIRHANAKKFKIGSPRSLTMAKSLKIRSWFIVAPSAEASTVHSADADVVVLDLTGLPESQNAVGDFCRAWADLAPVAGLSFLLPAFSSARTEAAIDLAIQYGAASVVLSGVRNGAEVQRLDMALRVAEIRAGLAPGKTRIVALANASGILAASSFERCSNRLAALGWEGGYGPSSDTARVAAGTIALTAAATGITAIDAVSPAGDAATFLSDCERARANGFSGKLCRSSDQIPIVNRIFSV
ncbi:aldolase/citrate lyase family protein [Neorhizobium sp. T25_27]|uniref:aldolase/citrate lyase family protein n=1 Tax=Neorhizobium sp. T25_27 TaxID=2093831 RepID=UPI00155F46C5|nr:aldolase/citrate lyase family protein [Neorhizobium sp. T25_27]